MASVDENWHTSSDSDIATFRVTLGRDRVSRARGNSDALVSFPDLGTRPRVRMRTKLENGVLHNGQQPQSVVNGFY